MMKNEKLGPIREALPPYQSLRDATGQASNGVNNRLSVIGGWLRGVTQFHLVGGRGLSIPPRRWIKVAVICGLVLLSAVICVPAYAGAELTLSGQSIWAIGTVTPSSYSATSGDTWEVTGSSDGTEDIYIKVDEDAVGVLWDPAESPAEDKFVLKHDVPTAWSDAITNSEDGIVLKENLELNGTQSLDLQFQAPSDTTTSGQHSLTVTLTAKNWEITKVTDYNGNVYNVVKIGEQYWMKENFRGTHYADGSLISGQGDPDTTPPAAYPSAPTVEGLLYNWHDATYKTLISGWHLPTDDECKTLEMYLGMTQAQADATLWRGTDQGTQLRQVGSSPFFEALLAGRRTTGGTFNARGSGTYFWFSTEYNAANAWSRYLEDSNAQVNRGATDKGCAFSVRLLYD